MSTSSATLSFPTYNLEPLVAWSHIGMSLRHVFRKYFSCKNEALLATFFFFQGKLPFFQAEHPFLSKASFLSIKKYVSPVRLRHSLGSRGKLPFFSRSRQFNREIHHWKLYVNWYQICMVRYIPLLLLGLHVSFYKIWSYHLFMSFYLVW